MTGTIHTTEDWAEMLAAMHSGQTIEVTEEVYYYFLEVLPPVHMGYQATLNDGTTQRADFGFAEGMEQVTAFWGKREGCDLNREGVVRYFAQRTKEVNPRG